MSQRFNEFNQPIGPALPDWQPARMPERQTLKGSYCRLEPLDVAKHSGDLYAAYAFAADGRDWTYLTDERPSTPEAFRHWLAQRAAEKNVITFTILCAKRNRAMGLASYMRIDRDNGSIELGGLTWSPLMKRTIIGTEALYLMLKYTFELGYRRCEWKCDALNAPSRASAERLGFQYEGTFRQMMTRKGRSRDTQWFSILDSEWPAINRAITCWLDRENFDPQGQQIQRLQTLLRAAKLVDGGVNGSAV
ncbi:GNAT family N-acetyltransferase [Erwinia tasmaniensis]|uniref:GNAT family N-acetyltransferase n=1 Tax=Erwinia tasmaniensis TaxID=338565 RepID=UPI003A4D40DF